MVKITATVGSTREVKVEAPSLSLALVEVERQLKNGEQVLAMQTRMI